MCEYCKDNLRELRKIKEQVDFLVKMFTHNGGALIQPKWVSVEVATVITGMGKSWLKQRQVRAGGKYNPKGIFRTRIEKQELVFFKKDLDAYEKYLTGEASHPQPIQPRLFTQKNKDNEK
jgi:hypothetical protein